MATRLENAVENFDSLRGMKTQDRETLKLKAQSMGSEEGAQFLERVYEDLHGNPTGSGSLLTYWLSKCNPAA